MITIKFPTSSDTISTQTVVVYAMMAGTVSAGINISSLSVAVSAQAAIVYPMTTDTVSTTMDIPSVAAIIPDKPTVTAAFTGQHWNNNYYSQLAISSCFWSPRMSVNTYTHATDTSLAPSLATRRQPAARQAITFTDAWVEYSRSSERDTSQRDSSCHSPMSSFQTRYNSKRLCMPFMGSQSITVHGVH